MFRRAFEGNAPHITFTADWRQIPFGNLVPGATVTISYDPNRLRSVPIAAFYQFAPSGPIATKLLEIPTGKVVERYSDDPVEATMMTAAIDVPDDAAELILWFRSADEWDSNYGRNYVFRFTSLDIAGEHATVAGDKFEVELTALPVVENVIVDYVITNSPTHHPATAPLTPGALADGRRAWSARGISVPRGANVRFGFRYDVEGRTFVDDNNGAGFWAPKPLPTHNAAAFLAALRERREP